MRILIKAVEAIFLSIRALLTTTAVTGHMAAAVLKFQRRLQQIYVKLRGVKGAPKSNVPVFQKHKESLLSYLERVFLWIKDNKLYTMSIIYAIYDLYDDLTAKDASNDAIETKIEAMATMLAYKASESASFDVDRSIDEATAQMEAWISERGLSPRHELRDDLRKALYEKGKEMVESRKAIAEGQYVSVPNIGLSKKAGTQEETSGKAIEKIIANEYGNGAVLAMPSNRNQAMTSISSSPVADLAYRLEKNASGGVSQSEVQLRRVATQVKQAKTLLGIREDDFIKLMSIMFELDMNMLQAYVRVKNAIE